MTTWQKELTDALKANGEDWNDVESSTLTQWDLTREFNNGFGGSEGAQFTLWTKHRVYFPVVYDGAEWVGWVSRNPDGKPTPHMGGQ